MKKREQPMRHDEKDRKNNENDEHGRKNKKK